MSNLNLDEDFNFDIYPMFNSDYILVDIIEIGIVYIAGFLIGRSLFAARYIILYIILYTDANHYIIF